jgi:hypothetical protein
MTNLTTQPTPMPTRKVVASTVGSLLGPAIGAGVLGLAGYQLSPDCAAQLGEGVVYAALGIGGLAGTVGTYLAGYITRERAPD